MHNAIEKVSSFHQAIGAPVSLTPELLPTDRHQAEQVAAQLCDLLTHCRQHSVTRNDLLARLALNLEELAEWIEAHLSEDQEAAADALGDRLYVLIGDAVAVGCPLAEAFDAVHDSNMTKVQSGVDQCGKALKGPGYTPPKLS